jgi:hypothetical protein
MIWMTLRRTRTAHWFPSDENGTRSICGHVLYDHADSGWAQEQPDDHRCWPCYRAKYGRKDVRTDAT